MKIDFSKDELCFLLDAIQAHGARSLELSCSRDFSYEDFVDDLKTRINSALGNNLKRKKKCKKATR